MAGGAESPGEGGLHLVHLLFGGLGGHAVVVRELTRELNSVGVRSGAILYAPPEIALPELVDALGVQEAHLVEKRGRLDPEGVRAIGTLLRRMAPRGLVWHAHYAHLAVRRLRRQGGLAFVTQVEHQAVHMRTLQDEVRSLLALTASDSVVFLTPEYRDAYRLAPLPLSALARASVIPNGVDLSEFTPRSAAVPRHVPRDGAAPAPPGGPPSAGGPSPVRLGMMGRMDGTKDFDSAIRAVVRTVERGDDGAVSLTLVGDGPDRERLEAMAGAASHGVEIHFTGSIPPSEVAGFLQGLDIYLHATRGETLSTSLLQAFATGLPVVASAVPGVTNLIREGRDGTLVPPGDVDALADRIVGLVRDPALRRRLGEAARRRAEAEFGAGKMALGYLSHWARVDPAGPWQELAGRYPLEDDSGSSDAKRSP